MTDSVELERDALRAEVRNLVAQRDQAETEVAQLRARVVMFLRCHYEEHKHLGSPTCFDVQAPSDEWESAALARERLPA